MHFTRAAELRQRAVVVRDGLSWWCPESVGAIVMDYDLVEIFEKCLLRMLVTRVQGHHWRARTEPQKLVGLSTLGKGIKWLCSATPKTILLQQILYRDPLIMAGLIRKIPADTDKLWSFLCEEPDSAVSAALTAITGPVAAGQIRAIFRAGLTDYAARNECAARARSR